MTIAARLREERGVLGFPLLRWLLVLLVLGLVFIEGGSILFTTIGLQNAADAAAAEAATAWRQTRNLQTATQTADEALDDREQDEARIVEIEADNAEPFEVRLTIVKRAATLVVHRVEFLEGFARVEVHAEARSVDSGI